MSSYGWIRLTALVCASAAVGLATALAPWGSVPWFTVLALVVGVAASEFAAIHLTVARHRIAFTLTEGAMAAALLLAPGSWVVVCVAAGLAIAQILRRRPTIKLFFNVSQFALGTACAVVVAVHCTHPVQGAVLGMTAFWVVNQTMSAVPIAVIGDQPFWRVVTDDASLHGVHAAATTSLGMLGAWLYVHAPLGLLALVVPVALMWVSFDQQTSNAGEARLFAELARGQEQATAQSMDISARVVLTAAARVLGGADVEMVLMEEDGPAVYIGDEVGIGRRQADGAAFDAPWVLRALGARRVLTGSEDGRPYCSAVIGDPDSPLAVLIARRPFGAAAFGRRDTALTAVLVGQAQTWLCAAELAASRDVELARADAATGTAPEPGDVGAQTAPTLAVLRGSATRLAQLAGQPAGERLVGEIVEELHALERAVASLLGAIALAADPDLAAHAESADLAAGRSQSPDVPAGPRAARNQDWTTTGVMAEAGNPS